GFPVFRKTATGPVTLPPTEMDQRKAIGDFVTNPERRSIEELVSPTIVRDARADVPGRIGAELLYRGHSRPAFVEVGFDRAPSVVWRYRPPTGPARFAVVGGTAQTSTLIIVLDWSLSMGYDQVTEKKHDRFKLAIEAFREVLRELPAQTVVGIFRSNGNKGDSASPLEMIREPQAYNFGANPKDLDDLIKGIPYPEGKTSPVAPWVKDVVTDREMFKKFGVGAKTLLVLTDGEDNISPNPFEVIKTALEGSGVSLKMALFQSGSERENAIKQYSGIRKLDPPGDYWEADQQAALVENLKQAMQPQIQVLRKNLEVV